jgi:diadenosine tetraphosphate (Ap4A) HIT family hydrolase
MHVATLRHCVVMLGENQGCEGWCVCVPREHVEHLDTLAIDVQADIFREVALVARAVRRVSVVRALGGDVAEPRINYECLGNVVPHVHWHVVPRHANDPTPKAPVWGWTPEQLRGVTTQASREELVVALREEVSRVSV